MKICLSNQATFKIIISLKHLQPHNTTLSNRVWYLKKECNTRAWIRLMQEFKASKEKLMSLSFHKSILDACAEVFSILKVEKLIKFLDICPSLIFSFCLEHFPACLCLHCVFVWVLMFFLLKFKFFFVLN
jgi:hypothetical protein